MPLPKHLTECRIAKLMAQIRMVRYQPAIFFIRPTAALLAGLSSTAHCGLGVPAIS